jgi:hypothetical protein
MPDDHFVFQSIDCEPSPGFLVRTVSYGYYGILQEKQEYDQWLVFLANGLRILLPQREFRVLPLSHFSNSPASFHEILKRSACDAGTEKAAHGQSEAPGTYR